MKPSSTFHLSFRLATSTGIMRVSCYLVLGVTIILQSCKTAYIPNALNVPLLQEKGELKFMVSPANYQAAYAVADHIGIIANGQFKKAKSDGDENVTVNGNPSTSFTQTNTVMEAGIGYLGKGDRNLIYEIYGGGGFTRTHIVDTQIGGSNILGNYDAKGAKLFVQPNIGFATKFFDVALSPRFTALQYGTSTTIYSTQYLKDRELDQLADHTHLFLEPAITLRGGYKFIKIQAQFGLALKLSSAKIPFNDTIGNVGLAIDIAKWYND